MGCFLISFCLGNTGRKTANACGYGWVLLAVGGVSMGKGITYSTSGRDCPCCGCQERAVGCHGTCERYKAWNGKRQAERQERIRRTSILHEADKRKSAAVSHYKRRGRQI